jgi:zinc/manganese transport system substrate-binding protein
MVMDVHVSRRQGLRAGLVFIGLGACGAWSAAPGGRIVASFSILGDMARALAPADIEVQSLVGPDADAHVFQPRPSHARQLAGADLVLINGLGFEGWIERLVRVSGYQGPVVSATRGITPRASGHHGQDPHAWHDLRLAGVYVDNLLQAFTARWPARADELQLRAQAYRAQLDALDSEVRSALAAVPRGQRKIITAHDAFGYLGAAYGLDILAARGWSSASEPSAGAVARLIRQIRTHSIRALFLENITDPRLIERIASETGARVGGTLYSDALSSASGPAPTYLALMAHNARTIVQALRS